MTSSDKELNSEFQSSSEISEDLEDILKWVKRKEFIGKEPEQMNFAESKKLSTELPRGKEMREQVDSVHPRVKMGKTEISADNMQAISLWLKQKESINKEIVSTKAEVESALMEDHNALKEMFTPAELKYAFSKALRGRTIANHSEYFKVLNILAKKKNISPDLLHKQINNVIPKEEISVPPKGRRQSKS